MYSSYSTVEYGILALSQLIGQDEPLNLKKLRFFEK